MPNKYPLLSRRSHRRHEGFATELAARQAGFVEHITKPVDVVENLRCSLQYRERQARVVPHF